MQGAEAIPVTKSLCCAEAVPETLKRMLRWRGKGNGDEKKGIVE